LENLELGKVLFYPLCSVTSADYIYAFNNGNIVDQGVHQDLIFQKGYYADLWNSKVM
jgi:ABC-type transport system involved in Fe-S cluster assembly fused permease/ATPase subunit